jgi:uncharacterized phage-associated protein
MTASARDVAAAVRERLPGVGKVALHKLLYYCQGHHLATFGTPLFAESISAWDHGPVVSALWGEEKYGSDIPPDELLPGPPLGEDELNTIGYVVSRYGALSGKDLENLSHGETPWLTANAIRKPGGKVTIRTEWIREYFLANGYSPAAGEDEEPLDSETVRDWLASVRPPSAPVRPDNRESILARLRG